MENLKIKATDEDSAIESRVLFRILGFSPDNSEYEQYVNWVAVFEDGSGSFFSTDTNLDECREITLQELRDMVVLNRNDPKDANVYQDGDISCLYDLYLTGNKELYFYHCGKKAWILSNLNHDKDYYELLKPIKEEVMKEYLVKTDSGNYLYAKNVSDITAERVVEIPQGANYAATNGHGIFFSDKNDFIPDLVVWVRESLNDKIATAEVARQEEKHSHYKKDVSHLNVIDPYRIADLYNLHPCADHIMKKSLCAGNRGHKDTLRDIQDIIDTAVRWKQMIEEDNSEI